MLFEKPEYFEKQVG